MTDEVRADPVTDSVAGSAEVESDAEADSELVEVAPAGRSSGFWGLVKTAFSSSNPVYRHTKRIIITVVGLTVLAAGLAMMVLPGPGIAAIILGLAVLATEYVWARKLLEKARQKVAQGSNSIRNRMRGGGRKAGAEGESGAE